MDTPRSAPWLGVVAFVAGAGTMIVELAAVRLLAPWFGSSSAVWTNVIGVILLALTLGYLMGARLSRGERPLAWLGRVLFAAAAVAAWLPFLAAPIAGLFMPDGVALHEAAGLLVWGSLASSALLFLPAALALGCVGPLVVEALQRTEGGHAGDAGGRVLAASTLGSLIGTFATTHILIPGIGVTRTFLLAALLLLAAGALVAWRGKQREAALAVLCLVTFVALGFSRRADRAMTGESVLIAAVESPYQSLRVVEDRDQDGKPVFRRLQVNESLDSFQSIWQPEPGLFPGGFYYNHFALPLAWALGETQGHPEPWRLCVVGLGAGTAVRVLEGCREERELAACGVELDPAILKLGREHFDLGPEVQTVALDGRAALAPLAASVGPFDQVIVDAYANNMEIPAHLCTVEFFREVRDILADGGWLTVNAAGFGLQDPVVQSLTSTVAAAFEGQVVAAQVPFSRNCMLYVRRGAEVPQPGDAAWSRARGAGAALLGALTLPGIWQALESNTDAVVLTDDLCPIDRLQLASIARGTEAWWRP